MTERGKKHVSLLGPYATGELVLALALIVAACLVAQKALGLGGHEATDVDEWYRQEPVRPEGGR